MIPPFDTVVKSPPSGVEIKAQTLAPIASSRPNGSAATTGPTVRRAQAARARAGVNAAAKARCRAQDAVSTRNSLRVGPKSVESCFMTLPPPRNAAPHHELGDVRTTTEGGTGHLGLRPN